MRVLWLTKKDIKHPKAQGIESLHHELARRLVHNGHLVTCICPRWKGSEPEEKVEGYRIFRARSRYKKYTKKSFDVVIDEISTIPFFTNKYRAAKNILFIHHLKRELWFHELYFPFNILGYILEAFFLKRLKQRKVITTSESTKKDLLRLGFKAKNIFIIPEGTRMEPVKFLSENDKYKVPTILSLGSIRPIHRTDHGVKAFLYAKAIIPDLRLIIAGDTNNSLHYESLVHDEIELSPEKSSITYLKNTDMKERIDLLKKSHVLCATSIKEGWNLDVTEANALGTPAVVYNVDGLRESVKHERTGLICAKNTPQELADTIIDLFDDRERYNRIRRDAWHWSKEMNFDRSYKEFIKVLLRL